MDQINKVKPTMENTNPFQWEMQLLAQEFNEREAKAANNINHLTDQENLREHNSHVAQLEDQKRRALAILDSDQEAEINLINKKYVQKFQEVEMDYTRRRDVLEHELYRKSGKSYRKLQKLHTMNLLEGREFERKANDILQRMAKSLREENTICVLPCVCSVPAAVAAVETPPVSSASESTTPVSQAERVIQDQYLVASLNEIQPLLKDESLFELANTPSMNGFHVPSPPSQHVLFEQCSENHSLKRQKTEDSSPTLVKNNPTPSTNNVPKLRGSLGTHIPTQAFDMASDETFDSHAKTTFSSTKTLIRDHSPSVAKETCPKNGSMSSISVCKIRPGHAREPLDNDPTFDGCMDFPPAFAQIAGRSHASLQTTRSLKSAPKKLNFKDELPDNTSKMQEESQNSSFKGRKANPSKRKASDINKEDPYEDLPIPKSENQARSQLKHDVIPRTQEPRRSATKPSRISNADDSPGTKNSPSSRKKLVEKPARRVTTANRSITLEAIRPGAKTYKPSTAEAKLSFVFISIEYMSYDAGSPSNSYPVTWSSMNGGHNYRLQVMRQKNQILHPYYGAEDKSSQYPKLVIDDSWILGGFFHKQLNNHRIEIYRPRSKKEYRADKELDVDAAHIQSARMRIKFTSGVELDFFLEWYRNMHPRAEMRSNDLLGSFREFFIEGSPSNPTLRREIENRAQQIALAAPVTPA
ncbi:hypothetical protein OCU04_002864 [Sclerotinia nivalis]|uniref:Uncharacterized protein n=1 Tax=Sclerotinia nivalis TaxID=352851 RepID=A0A9X0AXW9_9HELO|nr:hypothetical protein OCU04_002864 [Sclerotinia nivalis]